jgi:hypothetical protein
MLDPNKVGVAVECAVCGRRKQPVGRDAPMGWYGCTFECSGYRQEPYPGSLWPGESEADFGYYVNDRGTTAAPAAQKGGE